MLNFYKVATVFLTIVSGCTTWIGFKNMAQLSSGVFEQKVIPVFLTIASILIANGLWLSMFSWYPLADKETRKKMNCGLVIGCIFIFSVSTITSAMGIGGYSALTHHMDKVVKRGENFLNHLIVETERETELATSAHLFTSQFGMLSKEEKIKGVLSSYPGRDAVFHQLSTLSHTFDNIETAVKTATESQQRDIEEAKEEIGSLKELVANLNIPINNKVRLFGQKLFDLNQILNRIKGGKITGLVREVSRELDRLSASQAPRAESKLGKAQVEALSRVKEATLSAQKVMVKFTERAATLEVVEIPPLQAIDMGMAVIRYAPYIPVAWGITLGTDYFPFLLLFFAVWTFRQREEEEAKKLQKELQKELEG